MVFSIKLIAIFLNSYLLVKPFLWSFFLSQDKSVDL